ncbi:g3223 [Coccomyxa viridis]|uniref:G3223 protein n=1 Tax=Coccomyxa viridis TaxID=1274662 RepID=A0ABP1FMA4_9CHLO
MRATHEEVDRHPTSDCSTVPEVPGRGASELLLSDGERAQPSSTAHLEIQDASSHPSKERRKGGWRRCCSSMVFLQGVPCTTEIYGIGLVYTIFGFLDVWGHLPVNFFLKDDLGWSPSQLEFWGGLKALPWIIKPVYGILSDAVPLLGYHRRSYLIIFGMLGAGVWVGFSRVQTTSEAIAALMLASFTSAFSITVVDSILVTRTHGQSLDFAASLQSFCWGLQAVGKVVSAGAVGLMVRRLSPRTCFLVVAALPFLIALSSLVMREERQPCCGGRRRKGEAVCASILQEKLKLLGQTCTNKYLLMPAIFFFLWQITPSVDSAMFFFGTNVLHFSEEFYGTVLLIDGIAQVIGVAVYNTCLRSVALKKVFLWTALTLIAVHLMQLVLVTGYNRRWGVTDEAYFLVFGSLHAGLGRLALMPLVVLASRICPKGVEATVFGMLMSLHIASFNTGKVLGSVLTTAFSVTSTNFTNLAPLVLVCAIARFLPLPLLLLLPDKVTQSEDEDRPNDEENTHAAASSNGKADPSSAAKGSPGAKGLEA